MNRRNDVTPLTARDHALNAVAAVLFFAMLGVTMMIIAGDARSQDNYVLCRSLLDPSVTAVFPGMSCPSGWSFISHV